MATGQIATISPPTPVVPEPCLSVASLELRWFAVYTCANHEKRVADQLRERCVEYFLPLYDSERRWKDRRVKLQTPLFPGYVFVRIALRDRLRVLQVPGIVHLVGFGGHPAPLPQEDIQAIQDCLSQGLQVEPHPYFRVGRRMQVKSGPLQGLEGVVVRRKNRSRFVLSFDLLQRAVAIEVNAMDLQSAN
jgi:transcription antitermination factor NusG